MNIILVIIKPIPALFFKKTIKNDYINFYKRDKITQLLDKVYNED